MVLGDSIARRLPDMRDCDNMARGGETLGSLRMRLANGMIRVGQAQVIVMHVGTNDVANGSSPRQIAASYDQVIKSIKHQNPRATIVVSAIVPRWLDDQDTGPVIASINKMLQENSDRVWNCLMVRSDKQFRCGGYIRREFYDQDRLHLNARGSQRLRDFIATQTSRKQLAMKEACRKKCVRERRGK